MVQPRGTGRKDTIVSYWCFFLTCPVDGLLAAHGVSTRSTIYTGISLDRRECGGWGGPKERRSG
eukprot:3932223-Rhodomonas_salina.2